jgi:hypothetical protein
MLNLDQIKQRVEQLADQIHAPADVMPTYKFFKGDGTPNIEIDSRAYYYIGYERDTKVLDRQTSDLDVLLYWVFEHITSLMASDYVRTHRDPKVDARRIRFEHQLSLLEAINRDWKERREKEIAEILKDYPYRDLH